MNVKKKRKDSISSTSQSESSDCSPTSGNKSSILSKRTQILLPSALTGAPKASFSKDIYSSQNTITEEESPLPKCDPKTAILKHQTMMNKSSFIVCKNTDVKSRARYASKIANKTSLISLRKDLESTRPSFYSRNKESDFRSIQPVSDELEVIIDERVLKNRNNSKNGLPLLPVVSPKAKPKKVLLTNVSIVKGKTVGNPKFRLKSIN